LFRYQLEHNESFLGKKIEVLVENKMKKSQMYFGRNEYLSGVIFDGNERFVGKTLKIKINKVNQNLAKIEQIKKFFIINEKFSIENGMLTPTLKLKRYKIVKKYKNEFEKLY